ncbi:MAG: type II glyceraldehyde-3-phosphate dehydrogenase [Thaumarchaeota archaeon]|nr:type II glyceraldehyde-3-phosphate dehydrogenase [Nitrososphaerota archaeon]
MIRVGINGYGTIGRRVADAVMLQKDMTLVGATKMKPDYRAVIAAQKGIALYVPNQEVASAFDKARIPYKGDVSKLLSEVDVVVDATPELGAEYKPVFERHGKKAIFQGGEEHSLTGFSFVAQVNYTAARGKQMVRVVSCNTTALCRVLHGLDSNFSVSRARAVLVRRAADPDEVSKGPIDAIVPDPITLPSHHGPDVESVMTGLRITTMAMKVPVTHMHLHSVIASVNGNPTKNDVITALERTPRLMLVDAKSGFKSTAQVIDWAREVGRPRNDVYEAVVWRDSVTVVDGEVYLFLGVHQEAIVTPENVDAIRAVATDVSDEVSMRATDESLGIRHPGLS